MRLDEQIQHCRTVLDRQNQARKRDVEEERKKALIAFYRSFLKRLQDKYGWAVDDCIVAEDGIGCDWLVIIPRQETVVDSDNINVRWRYVDLIDNRTWDDDNEAVVVSVPLSENDTAEDVLRFYRALINLSKGERK